MKKLYLLTLLTLSSLSFGQDLLLNGGFEGLSTGNLSTVSSPWSTSNTAAPLPAISSAGSRSGSNNLLLPNDFVPFRQSFTAVAGTTYTLTLYALFTNATTPSSTDGITVSVRNNSGGNGTALTPNLTFNITPTALAAGYIKYTYTFVAPQTNLILSVFKNARSPNTNPANAARIDDVSIVAGSTSAVTVTGTPPFSYTYDATRKSPTFSSTETITYAYSGGGISGTQALGPINASSSYLALARVPEGTGFAYLATNFAIDQAPLTITANNGTKTSSQTFTTGSGSTAFTSSGLISGQTIGSITIASTGASNTATVGTYPIVPSVAIGGTFAASNYNITYVNGNLTVTETIGNYRSKASGNWNTLATWERWDGSAWVEPTTGEGYPGQFSPPTNLYIGNSHDVTCNVSVTGANRVGQLEFLAGASSSSLSIFSVNSLVVNGNVLIRSGGGNKTISVGSGFLSCGSISISDTGDDAVDSEITIATGGLFVFANLSMAGSSLRNAIRFTSSGNLSCGGSFTGGSLIPSSGRITFNGSGAQSVGLYAYNNLTLSGSGTKTVPSIVTVSSNLTISGTAIASLNTGTTYNVNSLTLGSLGTDQDTWGSTTSTATYKNNTYFSGTTGLINVATDTRTTPTVTPTVGSYTYNGNAQGPNAASNTGTGTSYTFSYVGVGGTTYGPSVTRPTNSGNYTVTATVAASTDGFYFSANSSATAFSINTAPLTITGVTADNKSYDGLTTTILSGTAAYLGLQNGESFGVTGTPSASFATAVVGTGKIVTVIGYTAPSSNYTLTQPSLTANITTASLTITADDDTKVYGQTYTVGSGSTAFTSIGLQNGETIGSITIASTGAVNTANVNTYSLVASAATGGTFIASNYAITYEDGTLEVTPASLTVTADDDTKVYGATQGTPVTGATTFSAFGLQNSDAVDSVALTYGSGAIAPTDNVGSTSIITPSAATGVSFTATNYDITYVDGTLEVTPAPLTITADDNTKVYGTTQSTPVFGETTFTTVGLQNSDAIDFVTLAYDAGAIAATDNVGSTSIITPSAATGGTFTATNYAITYVDGTLEVTPASLTITADDDSKVYGQTYAVGSGSTAFTPSGLQNGETIGSITIASAGAVNTANVNAYSLVASAATGGTFTAANYAITYVNGELEVTPASLTITANDDTKIYGEAYKFFGASIILNSTDFTTIGLQNADTIANITITTLGAVNTASVGTYALVGSSASNLGFNPNNYAITYVDGTLEVTPASLTITADDATKCNGTTYTFVTTAFTSIGLQNSETIGSVTLTSTGADSGALSGNYPIEISDAIGGTFTATNYAITYVDGTIFVQTVPTAGSIGSAQSICINTSPLAFTSEEFGDGDGIITYRWELNTDLNTPSWSTISGEVLSTYTPGSLTQTTQYRRITISTLNGVSCESSPTAVIQVTVIPLPVIGSIGGGNLSVCPGDNLTLTLNGSVGNILWHYAVTEFGTFRPLWGETSSTLVRTNITSGNRTTYFFAQVTNECATTTYPYSNKIAVTVLTSTAGTISGAGTICAGSTRTLTSTSSVGTVQWQSSTDNGVSVPFTNIIGATGATYTTDPLTTATYYRVVATAGVCGSATSASVVVNVSGTAESGSIAEGDIEICKGSAAPLTLTGNTAGVIAWYRSINATSTSPTWTLVSGQTTPTLTSGLLTVTTWYKARVTSGSCIDETPIVKVTVNPTSVVRSIAGTGIICNGSSRLLTLGAGSVGTLQWQWSTTSATANDFTTISGATAQTYLASPTTTTWYRVVATSGVCSSVTSAAIVVTVNQAASVGTITATTPTLCTGTGTTITLDTAQGTIAWQRATVTNGILGSFATIAGTTTTLATGNLTGSRAYRAVVTSGVCTQKATSNVGIVTIIPAAKVAAITGFNTAATKACVGTPKTLTLSMGYVGTIEWLSSPTQTGIYTVIPGATATTYTYTPSTNGVMYFKVRTTSSPCSAQAITTTGVAIHADTTNCTRQATAIASNAFEVIAYPNPSSNEFTIEVQSNSKGETTEIQVYDITGRLIESRQEQSNSIELGSNYPSGTYNVIVNQGTKVKTLRVIKK